MAESHLKVGAQVEVTSSIHSLRGTLFPAKIIATSTDHTKFTVEYHKVQTKLLRKIAGHRHKALRENLDVAFLRPLPPRERYYTFKFGDVVDAFFAGGWWEGVIAAVLKDSVFEVYFRFAKQKFEFDPDELRLHREWVKGSWVPPLQEDVSKEAKAPIKEAFREGTLVEVCNDEDGFQGAWFAASIVKVVGKDKFLIRYKSIRTDDGKELLTEEVDAQHIRPYPPDAVMVDPFSLNEEVDAFYNDGWWEGVICKILRGGTYRVYFKGTDDEMDFEHCDLRPRQEWIDRTWVMASQALKY